MTTANGVRSVRPTDLVALVSFDGEIYPNEAQSWERLARGEGGPRPLESAIEQWFSFATGRYTWISVRGQSIRGMLSARRRAGGRAWEVDCLILTEDDDSLLGALVERLVATAIRGGARRVFLRLRADSSVADLLRKTGFVGSRREWLFVAASPSPPAVADPPLRPRVKNDLPGLFGLYNATVPQLVRGLEATTMQEWASFQETRRLGSKTEEYVLEERGRLTAFLRLARHRSSGWLELACRDDHRWLDALLAGGLRRLGGKARVYVLVPEFTGGLAPLLSEAGFSPCGEFITLVKCLAVPVREAEPKPAAQPLVVT